MAEDLPINFELATNMSFEIAYYIFECNQSEIPIWYSKLIEKFARLPQRKFDTVLSGLIDSGMIFGKWEKIDGTWRYDYYLGDEALHIFKR